MSLLADEASRSICDSLLSWSRALLDCLMRRSSSRAWARLYNGSPPASSSSISSTCTIGTRHG